MLQHQNLYRELGSLVNSISLPGREEEAKLLVLSLVAKQHVVLVGPPGTAKTYMVRKLCSVLNVKHFHYLLTKFTLPQEIFGYPNIKELRENGKEIIVTDNKLPEAKIVFLDEIFNASSAILNTLLTVLNERIFDRGDKKINVPLWTCIGASNNIPESEELNALYDRFLFRHFIDYVNSDRWEEMIDTYWNNSYFNNTNNIDFSVIEQAHKKSMAMNIDSIKGRLITLFGELKKAKIEISDRRKLMCINAITADAVITGNEIPRDINMYVLKYIIPDNREQVDDVMTIVSRVAGEDAKIDSEVKELLPQVQEIVDELRNAKTFDEGIRIAEKLNNIYGRMSVYRNYKHLTSVSKLIELMEEYDEILSSLMVAESIDDDNNV